MADFKRDDALVFIQSELAKICSMQIDPDSSVLKNGLLDSIGLMELIIKIQDKYNLTVDLAELSAEEFDTPLLMVSYLEKHRQ